MKCPKCQFDNPDDTIYCGKCATPLKEEISVSQTKTLETPVEELTRGTLFADRYEIIEELGKGGMGKKTRDAYKKHGCVYLSAVGGAAIILAKTIKEIRNVYKLEFGIPEAIWELEVKDFPAVVTIDSNGRSLHK